MTVRPQHKTAGQWGGVLLAVLAALGPVGTLNAAWPVASDGASAWIVHQNQLGQWAVTRIEGTPPALSMRPAGFLPRPAIRMALDPASGRCIAVLREDAGFHPVREIRTATGRRSGRTGMIFGHVVLPPLEQGGPVVGLRADPDAITAIRAQPQTQHGLVSQADRFDLFTLTDSGWQPLAIGCAWSTEDNAPACVPPVPWPQADGNAALGDALVIGGGVYGVRREGTELVVTLGTGSGAPETARLRDIPLEAGVVTLGGQVVAVWPNADLGGSLWCASVTPLGMEVYRGPVAGDGPLPRREVVAFAAAFAMTGLSVLVWVLVPVRWRRPIAPPEGFAYADLPRRLTATLVDLLPGFLLVEAVVRAVSWLPPDALGVWPALAALVISALHSAAGEAGFGRTLGKWAMRCETRLPDGARPGRARAAARAFLKFACPPLTMLHLVVPPWVWTNPVALGTVVVKADDPKPGSKDEVEA